MWMALLMRDTGKSLKKMNCKFDNWLIDSDFNFDFDIKFKAYQTLILMYRSINNK